MSKFPPNAKYQPQKAELVSNETYASDLDSVSARLFVGCLNIELCTRHEVIRLFSMYGPLLGVTYFHKGGYAFVQFARAEDAEDAVENLNRYHFQGIRLDVKFVTPQTRTNIPITNPGALPEVVNQRRGKRGGQKRREREAKILRLGGSLVSNWRPLSSAGSSQQKVDEDFDQNMTNKQAEVEEDEEQRPQTSFVDQTANSKVTAYEKVKTKARKLRVEAAMAKIFEPADAEEGALLNQNEIPDLLICGGCHLISANAQFFYEHRLRRCDRTQPTKEDEPTGGFKCFHCDDYCKNSWDLIAHMARKHKIVLFRDTHQELTIEYPPLDH